VQIWAVLCTSPTKGLLGLEEFHTLYALTPYLSTQSNEILIF
jgi:hypothetical protein